MRKKEDFNMFCNKCGANLPDGTRACTICGADLSAQAQPAYQPPVYQQPVYQQPVYQQPVYQQPAYQQPVYQQPVNPGKGMGIASMVLGILSLVLFCIWYIAIPCAIIGVILGAIALKKSKAVGMGNGMAVTGIVCSIIAIAITVILLIIGGIAIANADSYSYSYYY